MAKKKNKTTKVAKSAKKSKVTKVAKSAKKSKKENVSKKSKKKSFAVNSTKSGVDTKVAKSTYTKVNGELASLKSHLQTLQKHVEEINSTTWYGGATANQWYSAMETANLNLVDLYEGIEILQEQLRSKFEEAALLLGIDF